MSSQLAVTQSRALTWRGFGGAQQRDTEIARDDEQRADQWLHRDAERISRLVAIVSAADAAEIAQRSLFALFRLRFLDFANQIWLARGYSRFATANQRFLNRSNSRGWC